MDEKEIKRQFWLIGTKISTNTFSNWFIFSRRTNLQWRSSDGSTETRPNLNQADVISMNSWQCIYKNMHIPSPSTRTENMTACFIQWRLKIRNVDGWVETGDDASSLLSCHASSWRADHLGSSCCLRMWTPCYHWLTTSSSLSRSDGERLMNWSSEEIGSSDTN